MSDEREYMPQEKELAYDTVKDRVGVVMEVWIRRTALRPVGGGQEWWCETAKLREPTAAERLSPRVAKANFDSEQNMMRHYS